MLSIEKTRISDHCLVNYGFDRVGLTVLSRKFNLDNNAEIKTFVANLKNLAAEKQKMKFEKCAPPQNMVDEMISEAKKHSEVVIKPDGTMSYDDYVWTMRLATIYCFKHCKDYLHDTTEERRKLIKGDLKQSGSEEYYRLALHYIEC